MSTELEEKVIRVCNETIDTIVMLPINQFTADIMCDELACLKYALDGKEDEDWYCLIKFNGAIDFLFHTFDFTEKEKGDIITTFLRHNAKIVNSKPYYYVEGVVGEKSYQEIVCDMKKSSPGFSFLPDTTKSKLEKRLDEQIISSEIERQELVQKYSKILDFLNKKHKPTYQEIYSLLKSLKMPSSMIKIFLSYHGYEKKQVQSVHFESFKKTIEEEPKRSKKELKSALQKYQAMESFDYANYEDVVGILRELNYPETQITNVMYDLFNKATMNYAYYKYIYEKYAMLNPNDPILKEILDMASAMIIPESIEDYIFWKDQILAMLDNIKGEAKTNNIYDLKRVYRTKK